MPDEQTISWPQVIEALNDLLGELVITENDCGTLAAIDVASVDRLRGLGSRARGRATAGEVVDPDSGAELIANGRFIDDEAVELLGRSTIDTLPVRSPLTCRARDGLCAACFGLHPATGEPVVVGDRIGETVAAAIRAPREVPVWKLPGYQLGEQPEDVLCSSAGTVRYGVLPDGMSLTRTSDVFNADRGPALRLDDREEAPEAFTLTVEPGGETHRPRNEALIVVSDGERAKQGDLLYRQRQGYRRRRLPDEFDPVARLFDAMPEGSASPPAVLSPLGGAVRLERRSGKEMAVGVVPEIGETFMVSVTGEEEIARIRVRDGQPVLAGDRLLEGSLDLSAVLRILGLNRCLDAWLETVLQLLVPFGWDIEDRYLETVFRFMTAWVEVEDGGDTPLPRGSVVSRSELDSANLPHLRGAGRGAMGTPRIMGILEARRRLTS